MAELVNVESQGLQRILLVNREPTLFRLTKAVLRGKLHVDSVQNLEQALTALKTSLYIAVLVDFCAFEDRSWKLLRTLGACVQCPPIVVLTTDTSPETRRQLYDLGAASLLYMPFNIDALRTTIAYVTTLN